MKKLVLSLVLMLICAGVGMAQQAKVLTLREQAVVQDRWLKERCQNLLPELMRKEGIDMWLVIAREYNEDPVLRTMLPATWLSARRTTMLLIYDPGKDKPLEFLACARYDVGEVFKKAWDPEKEPDQWKRLAQLVAERNPQRIGINLSTNFGHADGLSAFHHQKLRESLDNKFEKRLVSAERLAVNWLEVRTPAELTVYEQICRIAHDIIAEGLSEVVIQPGITTTDDVVWFYREKVRGLGLESWFHPTCDVQRADPSGNEQNRSFAQRPDAAIIQPGDLVHIDFGIKYLGLNTDTQQNAYVLKPGESAPPAYLLQAYQKGLRLMDILTNEYKTGRTGNEILSATLSKAKAEGLNPQIYSHPIGYHGHGAGPAIGMWDMQSGVPGTGDYPVLPNTTYAIELNNKVFLPEWNKEVRIMLEQNAVFDGEKIHYADNRQKILYLIPRPKPNGGQ
ncbi:MAG: M24 family metallopeptidase [Haliscomenobacter sp.]|uniref:M24 family metallopeptidase n=1 Tax=Haliscomenobacter sp. TaxID=2717303 RepID=UPI0029B5D126|nr:M24 family metallopeptidase [Haliscomenobacter sp.]MDX2071441.1 M24 family metallopeptidase [Haliscomenobacter sp.]